MADTHRTLLPSYFARRLGTASLGCSVAVAVPSLRAAYPTRSSAGATAAEVARSAAESGPGPAVGATLKPQESASAGRVAHDVVPLASATPCRSPITVGLGWVAALTPTVVARAPRVRKSRRWEGLAARAVTAAPAGRLHGDGAGRGGRSRTSGPRRKSALGAVSTPRPSSVKNTVALRLRLGQMGTPASAERPRPSRPGPDNHAGRRLGSQQVCRRVPEPIPCNNGLASNDGTAPEGTASSRTQVGRTTALLEATGPATVARPTSLVPPNNLLVTAAVRLRQWSVVDRAPLPSDAETVRPRRETVALVAPMAKETVVTQGPESPRDAATAPLRAASEGRCGSQAADRPHPRVGASVPRPDVVLETAPARSSRSTVFVKAPPLPTVAALPATVRTTTVEETTTELLEEGSR